MLDVALSLAVLMTLALPIGAGMLFRRGGPRKQVLLMLALAAILAANVAIWVVPTKQGAAPISQRPH